MCLIVEWKVTKPANVPEKMAKWYLETDGLRSHRRFINLPSRRSDTKRCSIAASRSVLTKNESRIIGAARSPSSSDETRARLLVRLSLFRARAQPSALPWDIPIGEKARPSPPFPPPRRSYTLSPCSYGGPRPSRRSLAARCHHCSL